MKKVIAAFAFAALAMSASAAITVTYGEGKTIADGGAITISKDDFKKAAPVPILPWEAQTDFVVSTTGYTVKITGTDDTILACETGGNCFSPTQSGDVWLTTMADVTVTGFDIVCRLRGADLPAAKASATVEITKGGDKLTFTIGYDTNAESGVANVAADAADIKAADNGLAYNVESPVAVKVYTAGGSEVYAATVEGSGILSLGHLASGIYLWSANGASGKVVVK